MTTINQFFLITLLIFLGATAKVWGQESAPVQRDQPSRYLIGKEEQMLLPVNIIGKVRKPGQYMVPFRTDLISLIAYAGGFTENAKINAIKIVRHAPAKVSNNNNGTQARVFKVDLKRYFEKGDLSQVPQLMPDDTIIVSATATQTVNKIFVFISKLAIIAQIAFYIAVIR